MSPRQAPVLALLAAYAAAYSPHPSTNKEATLQARGGCDAIPITIVTNTASWGREVSWHISSSKNAAVRVANDDVFGNNEEAYQHACLPVASEYTMTLEDSYGDGWNGGKVRIYAGTFGPRETLPAAPEEEYTLASGHEGIQDFTLDPPPGVSGPAPPDALDAALQAKLDEWKLLGFSVAYFKRGAYSEPIARGYGRTHADASQADPVTGDTVQMIASMSKTILGATVDVLFDAGAVGPDDDIKDTLPRDWPAEV